MPRKAPIPIEFEDLLNRAGKRVLAGTADVCGALADPRRRFVALRGMVDKAKAERLRTTLEREMSALLTDLSQPIPPETIWEMERNYDDWLPKSVRCRTAYLENRRGAAWKRAKELGLIDLLSSDSMIAFGEAVLGRKLDRKGGQQVLRYGHGDYSGPHTDHTPEIKRAAKGYLDLMLSYRQLDQVLCWGMVDKFSWLQNFSKRTDKTPQRPTPYDDNYRPKPLRDAIAAAFESAPKRT